MSAVDVTNRFARLVEGAEGDLRLDEACLLIAAHAHPDLDPAVGIAELDRLAQACPSPTLEALRAHLFEDVGFTGNREDYHDPRNSLLDEVLARRTGIPITLAVVAIETGRRIGVRLAGVGMPGHFLLRDTANVFVDPFNGRVLDAQGCEALYRRLRGADATFDPAFLDPVGPVVIVRRVLSNLAVVYSRQRDRDSLTWVLRLIALLPDASRRDHIQAGRVLNAGGRFMEAADHFDRVAEMTDDPDGAQKARTRATRLRARLN